MPSKSFFRVRYWVPHVRSSETDRSCCNPTVGWLKHNPTIAIRLLLIIRLFLTIRQYFSQIRYLLTFRSSLAYTCGFPTSFLHMRGTAKRGFCLSPKFGLGSAMTATSLFTLPTDAPPAAAAAALAVPGNINGGTRGEENYWSPGTKWRLTRKLLWAIIT